MKEKIVKGSRVRTNRGEGDVISIDNETYSIAMYSVKLFNNLSDGVGFGTVIVKCYEELELLEKPEEYICCICKSKISKPPKDSITTGYGIDPITQGKVCYECCAKDDKKRMQDTGKITLYLCEDGKNINDTQKHKVTNWPDSLSFSVTHLRKGGHNWAGVRYDVYFVFEGFYWHGTQYGDNSQLCYCKRTKEKV